MIRVNGVGVVLCSLLFIVSGTGAARALEASSEADVTTDLVVVFGQAAMPAGEASLTLEDGSPAATTDPLLGTPESAQLAVGLQHNNNDVIYMQEDVQDVPAAQGANPAGIEADFHQPSDVPEPGTLILLGLGLMGLIGIRRRKA